MAVNNRKEWLLAKCKGNVSYLRAQYMKLASSSSLHYIFNFIARLSLVCETDTVVVSVKDSNDVLQERVTGNPSVQAQVGTSDGHDTLAAVDGT